MALAREAMRIAIVKALRGETWARVVDSEAGAIDDIAEGSTAPVIAVYTDDGGMKCADEGALGPTTQTVVIEIAMTQRMRVEGVDDEQVVQPVTDAAMELAVGLIERQVKIALARPSNVWAQIVQAFVQGWGDYNSIRGTLMREGVRFAGRQLTYAVRLVPDPEPGSEPRGVWLKFITALDADADPGTRAIADRFREAIAGRFGTWSDWESEVARYGFGVDHARALGLMPIAGTEAIAPTFNELISP